MTEQYRKIHQNIDGVEIREHHMGIIVNEVPSDSDSPTTLNALCLGDVWLTMTDRIEGKEIPMDGIRFRTYAGGGSFPSIANELSILPKAFLEYRGQVPAGYKGFSFELDVKEYFPHNGTIVEIYKKKNLPKIRIKNIPCDDEGPSNLMDIEIQGNGNVNLRIREIMSDGQINKGEIIFKTAENGGKFPIMAFVFTRIAERILEAKKRSKN